jgi:hypothetical protein
MKVILKKEDSEQLEQHYRRTFVNSLAGLRQAVLVGTISTEGNTNLAIFNSLIHLGANHSLFGLISRPSSAQSDTRQNILQTKEYTVNYNIPLNGIILIIGSVKLVEMNASIPGPDGFVNLSPENVLISQGLNAYFVSNLIGRISCAKPLP